MPSCLGIYIQNNLIKYAKISKEHNNFNIETYGVKFYDLNIEETIEQIVKETASYQIPISVNIDKEDYAYSNVFNLLKPQDRDKAIETEFDFFCSNNKKNKNSIEYRSIKAPNFEDRDKLRVIYPYVEKTRIVERVQLFDKYKVDNISPIATIIPNINKTISQENCAIVDIEQDTEVTTMVNGTIYRVDKIDLGMKDILKSISERENSISRAYEICKNTTVYTKSGQNLKIEGNEYLDEIITVLFEIIEKVKDVIIKNEIEINSIYISGMGLIINNIDLLFQENFIEKKCEILVPSFIEKTNVKINIKDYIEVNSAIALAIQGLDTKNKDANFISKNSTFGNIMKVLNSDITSLGKSSRGPKEKTKFSLKKAMVANVDTTETLLLRAIAAVLFIIVLYIAITETLATMSNNKIAEADKVIEQTNAEIAQVAQYKSLVDARTDEYQEMVDAIDEANVQLSENYSSKNAIPNLLTKIMFNIPTGVQILSIENATGKNITIVAQAKKYDQLGYFKAILEEEGILTNITSTNATKTNNMIGITIRGELQY